GPDSTADAASTDRTEPAPVRLGVVAEDGTVVPVKRTRASRRRRWAMPIAVAAAAAVVAGAAGLVNGLLTPDAGQTPYAMGQETTSAAPSSGAKAEPAYAVYASGYNYTSRELSGPLQSYFGV